MSDFMKATVDVEWTLERWSLGIVAVFEPVGDRKGWVRTEPYCIVSSSWSPIFHLSLSL